MKTPEVKHLIEEVLEALPRPHPENVILDLFRTVDGNDAWHARYRQLCANLGFDVQNA